MTAVGGIVPRPTSETPSASGGTRRADIQGLRALAVLMVVAFHSGLPVPGGFVGVDVFFVISGFVITAMLMREWHSTGSIRVGRFYLRRFKRLTPALALTVTVTMVLGVFFLSPLGTQQDTARTGAGAMLLAANFVIARISGGYFDLDAESNALLNTWSLSVEEQFYLVFPALLIAGFAVGKRHRRLRGSPGTLVVAVGAVSFFATMLGASGYVLPRESWLLGFYSPVTRAWEFSAGAALALFAAQIRPWTRRISRALAASGAGLLAASVFVIDAESQFPGLLTLLPVAGTMALIQAGSDQSNSIVQALSKPTMVRIGDWSYSIYLWHWPMIVLAAARWPEAAWAAPIAALMSILPALASYYWVETPLRHYTPQSRARLAGLVASTLTVPLMLSIGLWQAAVNGFGDDRVRQFQETVFAQPDVCPIVSGLSEEVVRECTWNDHARGSSIYLLGDSNAGQFIDAVRDAGLTLTRPVTSSTTNACPFIDAQIHRIDRPPSWNQYCRDYTRTSKAFLSSAEPGLVVIANTDTYWDDPAVEVRTADGEPVKEPGERLDEFRRSLTRTIEALHRSGHRVLVVQTIPRWSGEDVWQTASCTRDRIIRGECTQEMPLTSASQRQGDVRTVVERVAASTGATVMDTWPSLCPSGICSTQGDDGYPRFYRDGLHISVEEGRKMGTAYEIAIAEASGP